MAQRKKVSRKRGASRSSGSSPFAWFVAGLVTGLGIAGFALFKGMVPRIQEQAGVQTMTAEPAGEPALIESTEAPAPPSKAREFDFFTVLPEMEVVVPEQELSRDEQAAESPGTGPAVSAYILQAGSFRSMSDAEEMKARLALLGAQANIEVVTVNDTRWHRVRIGPIDGARKADELRRLLRDNGIETMILKANA